MTGVKRPVATGHAGRGDRDTEGPGARQADGRSTSLPTRTTPRGTEPLELLYEGPQRSGISRGGLDDVLARLYAGDLRIPLRADRPTVVANFVETIDGVIALDRAGLTGGGEVSGFSPTDKLVMGILRALADVVMVGAATVRAAGGRGWTAEAIDPARADVHAELRATLGLAPHPTTLIVTGRGELDPGHRPLQDPRIPIVIAGPPVAAARLMHAGFGSHVRIVELRELADVGRNPANALLSLADSLGARLVLSEGGAHLIGDLVAARLLDELFVTLSPQLVGRGGESARLSLVEGHALWPDLPTWAALASLRRAGDHLFLRYDFRDVDPSATDATVGSGADAGSSS